MFCHPTHRGHVPRAGDTCQMVGTLPPHPGDTQKPSRACGTHLGQCTSQSRVQDVLCAQNMSNASGACSTCRGHVPHGRHAAPTSWEHAECVPGMCHTSQMCHAHTHAECILDVRLGHAPSQACGT